MGSDHLELAQKKIISPASGEYSEAVLAFQFHTRPLAFLFSVSGTSQNVELIATANQELVTKNNPEVIALMKLFNGYLEKTVQHPEQRLIMIEGGPFTKQFTFGSQVLTAGKKLDSAFETEEQAVSEFGEIGVLFYSAAKNSVSVICPEPPNAEIVKELYKLGASEDLAALVFASRYLFRSWYKGREAGKQKLTINDAFSILSEISELTGFEERLLTHTKDGLMDNAKQEEEKTKKNFIDAIIPPLNEELKRIAGIPLIGTDLTWKFDEKSDALELYQTLFNPLLEDHVLNSEMLAITEFRNKYFLDQLNTIVFHHRASPFFISSEVNSLTLIAALDFLCE